MNWGSYDDANLKDMTHTLDKAGNRTQVYDGSVWKTYSPDTINRYSLAEALAVTSKAEHQISSFNGITFAHMNDGQLTYAFNGTHWINFYYDALGDSLPTLAAGLISSCVI
jgi:hypothetical protein